MQVPLQVTFQNLDHSDELEAHIRKEMDKLERFYDRLTSAHVIISRPQHRHRSGERYHIRLVLEVPGTADIAISREPGVADTHADAYVAVRDAFKAARRQLQDKSRVRQGNVKTHETPAHGRIAALHADRDHGFIGAADGREIYFHRNSVAEQKLEDLEVGQEVRFAEAVGDKGPQATYVRPVGKHHPV